MPEQAHSEIMRALGRIEGLQEGMSKELSEVKDLQKLTNGRVTSLEASREQVRGASKATTIISSALTAVGLFIAEHLIFRK